MARSTRPAADPTRKAAFASGLFYLITFASSIPAALMLAPILTDGRYIVGPGQDTQILVACLLDLVNAFTALGSAVAVFSVLRRFHESLALGFVTTRLLEAAVIIPGVIALLAVVSIRQAGPVPGTDESTMVALGTGLVGFRDWTFRLGPSLLPGFNALMFATILYRTRLVPRWIPALGLIGGPLLIASVAGMVLGIHQLGSAFSAIATLPIFVWELSVGLWMTFKGFNRAATAALYGEDGAEANDGGPEDRPAHGSPASAAGGLASAAPAPALAAGTPAVASTRAVAPSRFARLRISYQPRRRHLFVLVGLWLAVVAGAEAKDHGIGIATLVLFSIAPRLALLLGIGQPSRPGRLAARVVPFHNAMHQPLLPLAVFALGVSGVLPELWFVGALAWLGQVVIDWGLAEGLRHADGSLRPAPARWTSWPAMPRTRDAAAA